MSAGFHPCVLIPSFDNPRTVRATVQAVRERLPDVLLVDDGSGPEGREACASIGRDGLAVLARRPTNEGKGAALKHGFRLARELGFTHAFQIDADGQHDLDAMPRFLEAARAAPEALVLGHPVYDASAPRSRLVGRRLTAFWVALELGDRNRIRDAMIGFRVYPLAATLAVGAPGNRMEFEIEIAVRLARAGTPVLNLPVGVRYLTPEQGGVSHFRLVRDNLRFFPMHTRLCTAGLLGWVTRRVRAGRRVDAEAPDSGSTWLSQRERGTVLGIRLAFRAATLLGRRAMRPFVCGIALWYRLFDRPAVAASRDWLTRVHGRPPGFWAIYRHLRTFAQVTLDRVFLLTGRTRALRFTYTGDEYLRRQVASGRGAVLLGAHLGSYEAMRARGSVQDTPIQIVGYFQNARMINALFERLNPDLAERVIHLGKDPVGVMVRVWERLEQGEMVAVLGDRSGLNERVVQARFFGQLATFASGPFLMAAALRCPVYLVFGIYHEPDRYDLHCEPFADRVDIPRTDRARALETWVQRYADRLEARAREAPDNWFNFFDFWKPV